MDGRENNGGARPGAGNPGYGKQKLVRENVEKYMPDWWAQFELMMNGEDKTDRKFAMSEFNKLQQKMIPTSLDDGDGGALQIIVKRADEG